VSIYFNGKYSLDIFLVKGLANGSVPITYVRESGLTSSTLGHVPPSPGNYFPDCVSPFHACAVR
jgi:hypothetical protein